MARPRKTFGLEGDGLWAWLDANPGAILDERILSIGRLAQKRAFEEFVTNKLPLAHFNLRFSPAGWDALGLAQRGSKYDRRKRKIMGVVPPYVSPEKHPHMREMVKTGWRVTREKVQTKAITRLKVGGARVLNLIQGRDGEIYRQQFLGLRTNAKIQGKVIQTRAMELFAEGLRKEVAKHIRREIAAAKAKA